MPLQLNRFPLDPNELRDFREAARKYILPRYAPDAPFLTRGSGVVSIGSCFAENIAAAMVKSGMQAQLLGVGESLNMVLGTRRILTHVLTRDDGDYPKARKRLHSASLLILTIGVALQSYLDGEPCFGWGKDLVDRIVFRMMTHEEVCDAIRSVIKMVRDINPGIHVVLTVSPIPLKMSPNHPSVFGQDCLSKSILRAAVEQLLKESPDNTSYWPSFEMIRWLAGHIGPFFGVGEEDNRHIVPDILEKIMAMFIERYFIDPSSDSV